MRVIATILAVLAVCTLLAACGAGDGKAEAQKLMEAAIARMERAVAGMEGAADAKAAVAAVREFFAVGRDVERQFAELEKKFPGARKVERSGAFAEQGDKLGKKAMVLMAEMGMKFRDDKDLAEAMRGK